MSLEKVENCPLCGSNAQALYLRVKDHSVSGELFTIQACTDCGFRFTSPRPKTEEIGKYYQSADYISHTNAANSWRDKLYQIARGKAIRTKYKLVKSLGVRPQTLLDYGCGTGEFAAYVRSKNWQVYGAEPDSGALSKAIDNHKLTVVAPENIHQFPESSFGLITLWHVLEHVHLLSATMQAIQRLLSSEGALIIAVPNSDSYDAEYYKDYWAAYDVPRHLYHFTATHIRKLAEANGFHVERTEGMFFDPFYISLLSDKYRNGKMNPLKAMQAGWKAHRASQKQVEKSSSLLFVLRKSRLSA